jgi:hypothetical protein
VGQRIGCSEHGQNNTDVQLGDAFHKGSYFSVNLLYPPTRNAMTGAEFVWGEHQIKDGSSAVDYRLQLSKRVTF